MAVHILQLFQRYSTYNGSHPDRVPGTLNLIPFVEYGLGCRDVRGGVYAIPLALEKLAKELGVKFRYGEKVEFFIEEKNRVIGAGTDQNEYFAACTLSNIDVRTTYQLLGSPGTKWQKRYEKQENSSSGFVFYWGMGRQFPQLGLHNIFFSRNYDREFQQLFDEQSFPEDPTLYVNITGKTSHQDAPAGKENWFVLVNSPGDRGQDWLAWRRRLRSLVTSRLTRILDEDIESLIEVEDVLSPDLIAARTGSFQGSLYGLSSNSRQAAFYRHPSSVPDHQGLFFCGGGAHPGGGMPLVVLSGANAAKAILKRLENL